MTKILPPARETSNQDALTPQEYAAGFASFLERCDERQECVQWIFQRPVEQRQAVTSLLSVGAGTGALDLKMFGALPHLRHYDGVEPNHELAAILYKNLQLYQQQQREFENNVFIETFEQFRTNFTYDLIIFAHSLYYLSNRVDMLKKALAMLSPRGAVWIFHQTKQGIHAIQEAFHVTRYHCCSDDIENMLRELPVTSVKNILPAAINVNDCPKTLIDFFLEKRCSAAEAAQVRDYLAQFHGLTPNTVAAFEVRPQALTS